MTRSQSMESGRLPRPGGPAPIHIAPFAEPTDYFDVRFSPQRSSNPWYLSTSQSARELAAQVSFEKAVLALDEHRGEFEFPRSAWSDDEETSEDVSEDESESESEEEDQSTSVRPVRLNLGARCLGSRATPPSNSSFSPRPTIGLLSPFPKSAPAPTCASASAPAAAPTWPVPPTPPNPSRISCGDDRSLPTHLAPGSPVGAEDVLPDDPHNIIPRPGLLHRRWSFPSTIL